MQRGIDSRFGSQRPTDYFTINDTLDVPAVAAASPGLRTLKDNALLAGPRFLYRLTTVLSG